MGHNKFNYINISTEIVMTKLMEEELEVAKTWSSRMDKELHLVPNYQRQPPSNL